MKKVILLVALVCSAFVFVSCDKERSYSRKIIGNWDMVKVESTIQQEDNAEFGSFLGNEPFWRWVFKKDKTLTWKGGNSGEIMETAYYTYDVVENTLLIHDLWGGDYTIEKLDSKELVLFHDSYPEYTRRYFVKGKK